jgi:acyl-CoA reductase-like NAD-dependent aldehyde dehydrogenase
VSAALETVQGSALEPYERYQILDRAATMIAQRSEQLAELIVAESAKPIRDARAEVARAAQSVLLCAEETKRLAGEIVPVEGAPGQDHRIGLTLLRPAGVVAAITPFNAPINQLTHKVPAAIAAGCAVVLKPSERTPACATALIDVLLEAGLPPGWVQVVHGDADVGRALVADDRVRAITFTGSVRAGRAIREAAGLRTTVLELGSSSANVVHHDADLEAAATALAKGAFTYAGQLCISVQRILVHESIHAELVESLAERVRALNVGDPADESTDVGPMITLAAARRALDTIAASRRLGARTVTGGTSDGSLMQPTLLDGATPADPSVCEEIFAPVASVLPYHDVEEAIRLANATPYGLSAGVFTRDIDVAFAMAKGIQTGTVNVNDVSTFRADVAPFGGLCDSGMGREGVRYAIREFCDERYVCFALRPPR